MLKLPHFIVCSTLVCFALIAGMAQAQPEGPPPPNGRGEGEGPRAMGRGVLGMPEMGMFGLLRIERVQKELNLTDQQKEALQELVKQMRDQRRQEAPDWQSLPPDQRRAKREEMRKQAAERFEKIEKKLAEILKPEQLQRLEQIRLQVHLNSNAAAALTNPKLAKALELTDQQRDKLKAIGDEARERMQKELRPGDDDARRRRGEAQQKMRQFQKETLDKCLQVLTAEQREKLDKMQGKKFDLDLATMRPERPRREPPRGERID